MIDEQYELTIRVKHYRREFQSDNEAKMNVMTKIQSKLGDSAKVIGVKKLD
jgi:hypothetical protein